MTIPKLPSASTASVARLPAALLCGFGLVPRVRDALLERGDDVSLLDVQNYLKCDSGSEQLGLIAKTKYERESLIQGYSQFVAAAEEGLRPGRARSDKLAWIIGDSRLTPEMELDSRTVHRITELELVARLGRDYHSWLPWMSLGMVSLFRRWRQPRIRAVRRALFKFSVRFEVPFPWEQGCAEWQGQLPLQALYRHEPSRLLDEALTAFSRLGLTSINDLRCCHPDAVLASKAQGKPLFLVYRLLERDGLAS